MAIRRTHTDTRSMEYGHRKRKAREAYGGEEAKEAKEAKEATEAKEAKEAKEATEAKGAKESKRKAAISLTSLLESNLLPLSSPLHCSQQTRSEKIDSLPLSRLHPSLMQQSSWPLHHLLPLPTVVSHLQKSPSPLIRHFEAKSRAPRKLQLSQG